jgi:hypothetical protein
VGADTVAWVVFVVILNYLAGWILAWSGRIKPFLDVLATLAIEEESPENSQQIKNAIHGILHPFTFLMVVFGFVGMVSLIVLYPLCDLLKYLVKGCMHAYQSRGVMHEVARRYGKAKRGHGIKLQAHPEEQRSDDLENAISALTSPYSQSGRGGGSLP